MWCRSTIYSTICWYTIHSTILIRKQPLVMLVYHRFYNLNYRTAALHTAQRERTVKQNYDETLDWLVSGSVGWSVVWLAGQWVSWLVSGSGVWLVGWLVDRLAGQSVGRLVSWLVNGSVGWPVGWSVGRSGQLVGLWVGRPVSWLVIGSTGWPVSGSCDWVVSRLSEVGRLACQLAD